ELQNKIHGEANRNEHCQAARVDLCPFGSGERDDETPDDERTLRCRALAESEKPERHHHERDVHEEQPSGLAISAFIPPSESVPEVKEAADETQDTQHVLAGSDAHVFRAACPEVVINA